jgi:hypothetical protein
MDAKITPEDIEEYAHLFKLVPAFMLERMAKRNANLVSKFESTIQNHMDNLTPNQRNKLDIILASEIEDLQIMMAKAYEKTKKGQFKVLAKPEYRDFIEKNLSEIRKMI